jgi:hypothetical protein
MTIARGLTSAALALVLGAALSGCRENNAINVVNDSGASVTIQFLSADATHDVATLKPHEEHAITVSLDPQTNCALDSGYQAVDSAGTVVAKLGKVCSGDVWTIAG